MSPGDVVLIYNSGRIRFAGEIAAKVRNRDLARYFWREDDAGSTWELLHFPLNEERTDVLIENLKPLFGYQVQYHPWGLLINETELAAAGGCCSSSALQIGFTSISPALNPEPKHGLVQPQPARNVDKRVIQKF